MKYFIFLVISILYVLVVAEDEVIDLDNNNTDNQEQEELQIQANHTIIELNNNTGIINDTLSILEDNVNNTQTEIIEHNTGIESKSVYKIKGDDDSDSETELSEDHFEVFNITRLEDSDEELDEEERHNEELLKNVINVKGKSINLSDEDEKNKHDWEQRIADFEPAEILTFDIAEYEQEVITYIISRLYLTRSKIYLHILD